MPERGLREGDVTSTTQITLDAGGAGGTGPLEGTGNPSAVAMMEGSGSMIAVDVAGGTGTNGDTWSVMVLDSANTVVFDASQVVTYMVEPQPCGPGSYEELSVDLTQQ